MNGIEISLGKDQQLAVFDKDGKELVRLLGLADQSVSVKNAEIKKGVSRTTYSYDEFVQLVKDAKGHFANEGPVAFVRVGYPSDPRCKFQLLVYVDRIAGQTCRRSAYDTDNVNQMCDLFDDWSIMAVEWPRAEDKYVVIVRNLEKKK